MELGGLGYLTIFYPDFGGKVSNFTDFVFYRSKKTAVLEKIGYA